MRYTLFFACVSAATAIGCHADGRRRGGNAGYYQGCNQGCAPLACVPGVARIRQEPMPPAPAPIVQKPKPAPRPRTVMKEVKYTPKSKFGHAKNFSWLVGQLQKVHVNGGNWKIRYSPLDVQDKWGGSVILSQDARVDRFEDGDFVYVEGEILATRPTVYLAGPLYRISKIRKTTEADGRKAWGGRLQSTTIRK